MTFEHLFFSHMVKIIQIELIFLFIYKNSYKKFSKLREREKVHGQEPDVSWEEDGDVA